MINDYVIVPVGNSIQSTPPCDLSAIYTLLVYAGVNPVGYYRSSDEDGSCIMHVKFSAKQSIFDIEEILDNALVNSYKIIHIIEITKPNTTAPLCT